MPNAYTVTILVHRTPIETAVRTSFGVMHDRPSLLIAVADADGHVGWGEVWCNFPAVGAEHRARLLHTSILPTAVELGGWDEPATLWQALNRRFRVLALQTGEFGPIAQCLAGLDCALHDLAARQRGLPLYRYLRTDAHPRVAVYASGINPTGLDKTISEAMAGGHSAFKLKVGFGADTDAANLKTARNILAPAHKLMVDANQGWTLQQALDFADQLNAADLHWVEEPLAHDAPDREWQLLADKFAAPLAAGENFGRDEDFEMLPETRRLGFVQPDVGKWGGISRFVHFARQLMGEGRAFCPHWLGGGVGLLASLHVKAAIGGGGMAEVDVNPNTLRDEIAQPVLTSLNSGSVTLGSEPGIGQVPSDLTASAIWSAIVDVPQL